MEQGPDELGDNPDERADKLEEVTDRPLDANGGPPTDDNPKQPDKTKNDSQ